MRVAEVHIEGFGRLVNLSFRFTPGFNLIVGPNEAGKSTLQRALLALLYGFHGEGPDTAAERELVEALKPWDATAFYAGSLTYVLDKGQAFRVSRRFLPRAETSLRTHPEGVDVSGQFKSGAQGRLFFANEHWGLGKQAFETVCVVRQAELAALESSAATITGTLERLLAAVPVDPTTSQAANLLEKALQERVGMQQSQSDPLPLAVARLSRLQDERAQALQGRRALFSQHVALSEAGQRLEALDRQREQLLLLQAEAERSAARSQIPAINEVAMEVGRCDAEVAKWQTWAAFPAQLRDEGLRLSAQRDRLQEECVAAERKGRRAQEGLRAIEAQEAALKERLAEPASAQRTLTDEFAHVHDLASEWRMTSELEWSANERSRMARTGFEALEQTVVEERKPLEAALPLGVSGLAAVEERLAGGRQRLAQAKGALSEARAEWARFDMEDSEFQQLEASVQESRGGKEPAPEPRQGRGWLSGIRGVLERGEQGPRGLALYSQVQPVYAQMVRCRTDAEAAQRALSDVEATTLWQLGKLLGGTLDESAFAQLSERLERHQRAVAELEQQRIALASLQSELEGARTRHNKAQKALQAELSKLGFDAADVHKALAAYVKKCERKDELSREDADLERSRLRAEVELEVLRVRAEALQGDVQDWQDKQAALAGIEGRLVALLAQAGINCTAGKLDDALATFQQGFENYQRWERAKAALDAATRYQRTLLDVQASAVSRGLMRDPAAGRPLQDTSRASSEEDPKSPEQYVALIEQLDDQRARAQEEYSRLEAAIREASSEFRHPAEIDEEIAETQAEIERLERLRDALELARSELGRATEEFHQQFAPRLEMVLNDGLSDITSKRYSEAIVDPSTLAVAVRAPELAATVPVDRLSGATRDLVYLLLRVSIARLLSRAEEKLPVLLDDPLAQLDQKRQERALEYLARLAEETQVFFFSKDEALKAWCEKRWGDSRLHRVHTLNAA